MRIKSFCCGIPLKSAALIYAVYNLGVSLFWPLVYSLPIMASEDICEGAAKLSNMSSMNHEDPLEACLYAMSFSWLLFFLASVPMILHILLLIGIIKKKSILIKIHFWFYVINNFSWAVTLVIIGLVAMFKFNFFVIIPTAIIFALTVPVPVYFLITLRSLAHEYDENENGGRLLDNVELNCYEQPQSKNSIKGIYA